MTFQNYTQAEFEIEEANLLANTLDDRRRGILLQALWVAITDRDIKVRFLTENNLVGDNDIEDFDG